MSNTYTNDDDLIIMDEDFGSDDGTDDSIFNYTENNVDTHLDPLGSNEASNDDNYILDFQEESIETTLNKNENTSTEGQESSLGQDFDIFNNQNQEKSEKKEAVNIDLDFGGDTKEAVNVDLDFGGDTKEAVNVDLDFGGDTKEAANVDLDFGGDTKEAAKVDLESGGDTKEAAKVDLESGDKNEKTNIDLDFFDTKNEKQISEKRGALEEPKEEMNKKSKKEDSLQEENLAKKQKSNKKEKEVEKKDDFKIDLPLNVNESKIEDKKDDIVENKSLNEDFGNFAFNLVDNENGKEDTKKDDNNEETKEENIENVRDIYNRSSILKDTIIRIGARKKVIDRNIGQKSSLLTDLQIQIKELQKKVRLLREDIETLNGEKMVLDEDVKDIEKMMGLDFLHSITHKEKEKDGIKKNTNTKTSKKTTKKTKIKKAA